MANRKTRGARNRGKPERAFAALVDSTTGRVALIDEGAPAFQNIAFTLAASADPGTRQVKLPKGGLSWGTSFLNTTAYQRLTGTVLPSLRQRLLPNPTDLEAIVDRVEFYRKLHPWVNRALILRAGINATAFRINAPGNEKQDAWMLALTRKLRMYSFMREFFRNLRAHSQVVVLWRTSSNGGRTPRSIECASLKIYQPRFNPLDGSRPNIVALPGKDPALRRLIAEAQGANDTKKAAALEALKAYPPPLIEAARSAVGTAEVPAKDLEPYGFRFEYAAYDRRHDEDWAFPGMYSIFPYLEMLMLGDDADINALHHYKAGILLVRLGPEEPTADNAELIPADNELKALDNRLQEMVKARLPHWAARGDLKIDWVVPPEHIINPEKVASAKEKVLDWLGLPLIAYPGQEMKGAYATWQAALKVLQQESKDEREIAKEFAEEWYNDRSEASNQFGGTVWPRAWFDPNALNEPRIILEMAKLFKTLGGADEMTISEMMEYDAEVFLARRKSLKDLKKKYKADFAPEYVPHKTAVNPQGRPATRDQATPEDSGMRQPRPSTSEAAEIIERRFGISAAEVEQALEEEFVG